MSSPRNPPLTLLRNKIPCIAIFCGSNNPAHASLSNNLPVLANEVCVPMVNIFSVTSINELVKIKDLRRLASPAHRNNASAKVSSKAPAAFISAVFWKFAFHQLANRVVAGVSPTDRNKNDKPKFKLVIAIDLPIISLSSIPSNSFEAVKLPTVVVKSLTAKKPRPRTVAWVAVKIAPDPAAG